MKHRPVSSSTATEPMSLHDPLKTLAFAGTDDVYMVFDFEYVGLDLIPSFQLRVGFDLKLDQLSHRRNTALLEVPCQRLADSLVGSILDQTYLDSFVSVIVGILALHDQTGACLNNRDGMSDAIFSEDLRHSQFLT